MKYLTILISFMILMSCATNPFNKNYSGSKEAKRSIDQPVVLETYSMDQSVPYLKSQGFRMLGESQFTDYFNKRGLAEEQANFVNASVVVINREFKEKETVYVPKLVKILNNPNKTFVETAYTMNKYDYHATYWVKDGEIPSVSALMTAGFKLYGVEK